MGQRDKLQEFCDVCNSLKDREDVRPNGFGKFWLANLYAALGYEYSDDCRENLRGAIFPDGSMEATLFFPDTPEESFELHDSLHCDSACLTFSTVSAWDIPYWLEEYLFATFGEENVGYQATDEFNNFCVVHNKGLMPWIYRTYVEESSEIEEFKVGEEKTLLEYLAQYMPIPFLETYADEKNIFKFRDDVLAKYNEDKEVAEEGKSISLIIYE